MDASLSDFLIQFVALSAIGGFAHLIYSLNHNSEPDEEQTRQYE